MTLRRLSLSLTIIIIDTLLSVFSPDMSVWSCDLSISVYLQGSFPVSRGEDVQGSVSVVDGANRLIYDHTVFRVGRVLPLETDQEQISFSCFP